MVGAVVCKRSLLTTQFPRPAAESTSRETKNRQRMRDLIQIRPLLFGQSEALASERHIQEAIST
jgi:hypothetical protein